MYVHSVYPDELSHCVISYHYQMEKYGSGSVTVLSHAHVCMTPYPYLYL